MVYHPHERPDIGPARGKQRSLATVWSGYRKSGMPVVGLIGVVAVALGRLEGLGWLTAYGAVVVWIAVAVLLASFLFSHDNSEETSA